MLLPIAIFLDFNLPNATTWFYFSFLLGMALFFKFGRLLSVRNLDVVMIFLLVPGLLAVQAARPQPMPVEKEPAVQIVALVGQGALADGGLAGQFVNLSQQSGAALENPRWLWVGYLWLAVGSIYFFARCLLDLILVQRPALGPNLQIGGLAWLAGALLICMLAVAYRQVERNIHPLPITGPSASVSPVVQPLDQTVFAVAILWRDWPAWAVAALAFAGHVVVIVMLALISWRHFQDVASGMAAVTFYLLLPYTGFYVGQLQHVLPMALFLGAVLAYRSPTAAGFILGIATAATYFPAFVLPIWLSFYRGCGMGRFLAAFLVALALGFGVVGLTLSLHGELEASILRALASTAWQPWTAPPASVEGLWTGVPWAYRIPVLLVFLSFVVATMFWPAPKNLAHVVALCAAVIISLQWWCADQGGAFILWYLPLMLLLVFRPNLHDRVAPPIVPETDWLTRSLRWCVRRIVRLPEPAEKHPV